MLFLPVVKDILPFYAMAESGAAQTLVPALALDGDGLGDGDRAVTGRVERVDFTPGTGRVHCGLEMAARRGEAARIAVIARRRNEGSRSLSLCGDWLHSR